MIPLIMSFVNCYKKPTINKRGEKMNNIEKIRHLKFRASIHLENASRCERNNNLDERDRCYACAADLESAALKLENEEKQNQSCLGVS